MTEYAAQIPDDNNFNVANDYDWFSGLYASSRTWCPLQETQFYLLARNVGGGSPTALGAGHPALLNGVSPRDIYTVGTRMRSLPGRLGPWDYSFEAKTVPSGFRNGVWYQSQVTFHSIA